MFNAIKTTALAGFVLVSSVSLAESARNCSAQQIYRSAVERCVDKNAEDVIALGTLKVETAKDGERVVILQDETRGNLELSLTPTLVEAIEESPADSYEVEGYLNHTDTGAVVLVKTLRPIE